MNRFDSQRPGIGNPVLGPHHRSWCGPRDLSGSCRPGRSYLIGRDPQCDIVVNDARVSLSHAVLRLEDGRWVLADNGSTNGTYAGNRRVDRIEINGECLVRLSDPADGPFLSCTVSGAASSGQPTLRPEPSRRPACRASCGRYPPRRCASAGRRITTSWSPTSACPATMPNCAKWRADIASWTWAAPTAPSSMSSVSRLLCCPTGTWLVSATLRSGWSATNCSRSPAPPYTPRRHRRRSLRRTGRRRWRTRDPVRDSLACAEGRAVREL